MLIFLGKISSRIFQMPFSKHYTTQFTTLKITASVILVDIHYVFERIHYMVHSIGATIKLAGQGHHKRTGK